MKYLSKIWIVLLLMLPSFLNAQEIQWQIISTLSNTQSYYDLKIRVRSNTAIKKAEVWADLTQFDLGSLPFQKISRKNYIIELKLPPSIVKKDSIEINLVASNNNSEIWSTNALIQNSTKILPSQLNGWDAIMDFVILAVILALATFLKRVLPIFKKFLIPNAMIAGILALVLGPEVLGWVYFSADRLLNIVYHLMAVGFIALTLKDEEGPQIGSPVPAGAYIVSTYLVQGILGLGIMLIIMYFFNPAIFVPIGALLPLGFGQGPGQALSIGMSWEGLVDSNNVFRGLTGGGKIGVTIATLGFVWATIGGVIYMNILNKKIQSKKKKEKLHEKSVSSHEQKDRRKSDSVDHMSIQLFLIGIVYLFTYLTLVLFTWLLPKMGNFGENLARMFWGFHFIFGAVYAMILKKILHKLRQKKKLPSQYPNNRILTRIAGTSFDYMITASIASISLTIFMANAVPIMLITTIGGFVTLFFVQHIARRYYKDHTLEYSVAMFGMLTGTISTGMALLKEVDPRLKSPVAEDMVLGSGTGLLFGFPILLILPVIVKGYVDNKPSLYWLSIGLFAVCLAVLLLVIHLTRRKAMKKIKSTHK